MSLQGKRAVITGSTSGIGHSIAVALAKQGCDVLLNGFGEAAAIEALTRDLAAKNRVKAFYSAANLATAAGVSSLIAQAQTDLGGIDILVNNAGIQHTSPIEDFLPERWDAIIALNLSAVFHAIHQVIPGMRRQGWGRIINIASVHGLVASPYKAAYVAAKHGVLGLTKVTALELATTRITCNAICPGWVRTPLVERQIEAKAKEQSLPLEEAAIKLLAEKQPSQRFTLPEDIGALTVFLCSEAAGNMTGTSLPIDGAWTAQ
ncbi:MAG: 3-hydroxybutyrate dehydrogenase [Alphaproteobacteria bacterium]